MPGQSKGGRVRVSVESGDTFQLSLLIDIFADNHAQLETNSPVIRYPASPGPPPPRPATKGGPNLMEHTLTAPPVPRGWGSFFFCIFFLKKLSLLIDIIRESFCHCWLSLLIDIFADNHAQLETNSPVISPLVTRPPPPPTTCHEGRPQSESPTRVEGGDNPSYT